MRKDLRQQGCSTADGPFFIPKDASCTAAVIKDLLPRALGPDIVFTDDSKDATTTLDPACLEEDLTRRFKMFLEKRRIATDAIIPLRTVCIQDIRALYPTIVFDDEGLLHPLLSRLESLQHGMVFAASRMLDDKKE